MGAEEETNEVVSNRTLRIIGGSAAIVGGAASLMLARNTRQRIGAVVAIMSGVATIASEF